MSEPATVTVQGVRAATAADQTFQATVPVAAGTNVVSVVATDPSGNSATAAFDVDNLGTPKAFTYDANGNLTSDGTRTFEWDARNQLLAVNVGTHRSEFSYDGLQRRVRVVEKDNGVPQSDTKVVWSDTAICEGRSADGTTVTRRGFSHGEQISGSSRFFATDHLGSVTELTDGWGTLMARYAFDPWGRRSIISGSDATSVGFTGHQWRAAGGVSLTLFRAYDGDLARWLSEDPAGRSDGPNLYAYVKNQPTRLTDPEGLKTQLCCRPLAMGVGVVTGQRHCFVVIVGNRQINGGAATGYSLTPKDGQGQTHINLRPDMDWYFKGTQCYDVPDCDACKERKIDESYQDPGRSGEVQKAWSE